MILFYFYVHDLMRPPCSSSRDSYHATMHHGMQHKLVGIAPAFTLSMVFLTAGSAFAQAPNTARAHHPIKISPTEHGGLFRLGTFAQTRHWAPMSSWTTPAMHGRR